MNRKVNLMYILSLLFLIAFTGCEDDDEGLKLQDHDKNEFMTIMHAMNAQMDAMQMTGDPDHDFAMMMIAHHQGAIDMANKELEKGNDLTMRDMAQKIIDEQTAEKAELTTWLQNNTPVPSQEGQTFNAEIMATMAKMKNWKDIQVLTGDADNDFAVLMIVHHQTAIDNAQSIIHHGHHDDIKEMATMMVNNQNQEITDLTEWLKTYGATKQ